jgi:hypothetical protein
MNTELRVDRGEQMHVIRHDLQREDWRIPLG